MYLVDVCIWIYNLATFNIIVTNIFYSIVIVQKSSKRHCHIIFRYYCLEVVWLLSHKLSHGMCLWKRFCFAQKTEYKIISSSKKKTNFYYYILLIMYKNNINIIILQNCCYHLHLLHHHFSMLLSSSSKYHTVLY